VRLAVIIAAGGAGSRMGAGESKQMMLLAGRPVLARTIGIFDPLDEVEEIVVAIEPSDVERCRSEVVEASGFSRVSAVVGGGADRAGSVKNALGAVGAAADTVLVHDGARPLFDPALLPAALRRLDEGVDGVVFGRPLTDTVKQVDGEGAVTATPDRSRLWVAQTPQIFRRRLLEEAYRQAPNVIAAATDDASLVEGAGGRVEMLEGNPENIKLTIPFDLEVAGWLIASRGQQVDGGNGTSET